MMQIPQSFKRSVNKSNVDQNSLADWLEAIVLFDEKSISKSEVVDNLIEYQICPDDAQDLAHTIASEGWVELNLRKSWGGLPESFHISTNRVDDETPWYDDPIRSFFLLLSLMKIFPDWAQDFKDHVTQGNLFEEVVEIICPALLPGWKVYRAGWSPDDAKDIPAIVKELCNRLYVSGALDLDDWHSSNAKDGGLDIVCYRSFLDTREAMPVYFLQCASGKNWRQKITTPNASVWQKLLNSAVLPSTGIAAPFVIENRELRIAGLTGQITIFDRLRMLSAVEEEKITLPADLEGRLLEWMSPRIDGLPRTA